MSRPPARATIALAAYAVGLGVASADGWRLSSLVAVVSGLQGMWGLGAWFAGRVWSRGGSGRGAVAGAAFGVLAIASYYAYEAAVYGPHSAVSQLTASGGYWVPAAAVAGALCGVAGAWAARPTSGRLLDLAALGHLTMAGALVAESVFVLTSLDRLGNPESLAAGTAILGLAALWLVGRAWSHSGARTVLAVGLLLVVTIPVLAVGFLAVQHRLGYLTM